MAANQTELGVKIAEGLKPQFADLGLALDSFVVENLSLPEELQKMLDTRIGMNMIGDMGRYTQYQVANSLPIAAGNEGGGIAGIGVGLGAGLTMAQQMMNAMNESRRRRDSSRSAALAPPAAPNPAPNPAPSAAPCHRRRPSRRARRRDQVLHRLRQIDPQARQILSGVRRRSNSDGSNPQR